MLADFSIWTLDDPDMSDDMAVIRETLQNRGVEFTMNRMSTTIEGTLSQISESIEACRQSLAHEARAVVDSDHL